MRTLYDYLIRNVQYKAAALALATLFWYLVQGEEVLEVTKKVHVDFKAPPGFFVQGGNIRYRDATIKGSRALIGNLPVRPLEAVVNLTTDKASKLRHRISKDNLIDWDNRISVTIHDPYIEVFVDQQITKRVAVKGYLQGLPAEGSIIEKTTVSPKHIYITGFKSQLKTVTEISTEPIDISGIQKSRKFEAIIATKSLDVSLSRDRVSISLQVGEKKVNKRFQRIPIEVKSSKDQIFRLRPLFISIVIQGTEGVLNFVKTTDLSAFLDITDLGPGSHEKKVQVKIPSDTILIETQPMNATIQIQPRADGTSPKTKNQKAGNESSK